MDVARLVIYDQAAVRWLVGLTHSDTSVVGKTGCEGAPRPAWLSTQIAGSVATNSTWTYIAAAGSQHTGLLVM